MWSVSASTLGLKNVNKSLTKISAVSVLVIEYGPLDQAEDSVRVPGAYFPVPYLWMDNWVPLLSTPQTALNNKVYGVTCGRVVGGGSAVNAMFWHRAGSDEYDAWNAIGAFGWGWKQLLPYFKKVMKSLINSIKII